MAFAFAITGCVNLQYSEYTGGDAGSYLGTWPVGQGTMAETRFAVPVYRGWPEKPYRVLGSLTHPDPKARWNDDFFAAAASQAKKLQGDAVIIREGAEFGISKIADTTRQPLVLTSAKQTTALVVHWLTPHEIDEQNLLLDDLLKRSSVEPRVSANRTVGHLVIRYLLQSGSDLKSVELQDRFIETMRRLVPSATDGLGGDWIFKASEVVGTVLGGNDEETFLGLASVSVDGENIAIVSSGGGVELNFSGMLSKGRLTGQIGVGGVSSKCEGAATAEKLSISFQSLTPDGMVRGNLTLQRLSPKIK